MREMERGQKWRFGNETLSKAATPSEVAIREESGVKSGDSENKARSKVAISGRPSVVEDGWSNAGIVSYQMCVRVCVCVFCVRVHALGYNAQCPGRRGYGAE